MISFQNLEHYSSIVKSKNTWRYEIFQTTKHLTWHQQNICKAWKLDSNLANHMLHIVEVVGAWAKKGQDYEEEQEEELARPFSVRRGSRRRPFTALIWAVTLIFERRSYCTMCHQECAHQKKPIDSVKSSS